MNVNINCIYNEKGAWCTNLNVKRAMFGFGARCCVIYPGLDGKKCRHKVEHKRPSAPPKPPPRHP
jgi:hypothetical protein